MVQVFISLRFNEALKQGEMLKKELEGAGVSVFLCAVHGGENIAVAVAKNLVEADLVVILGTASYGEQTSSSYSTYQEMTYVMEEKKPFFLIKMCDKFQNSMARFYFNSTIKYYYWPDKHDKLPPGLVQEIIQKLGRVELSMREPTLQTDIDGVSSDNLMRASIRDKSEDNGVKSAKIEQTSYVKRAKQCIMASPIAFALLFLLLSVGAISGAVVGATASANQVGLTPSGTTSSPSKSPTLNLTPAPSSLSPTSKAPSQSPTKSPTRATLNPTFMPTFLPTPASPMPTQSPTLRPTARPSFAPTPRPTLFSNPVYFFNPVSTGVTKLAGVGNVGGSYQGISIDISSDGSIAIVGGFADDAYTGAAWTFKNLGDGQWVQQAKLVGFGTSGSTGRQGNAVAISGDGKTAASCGIGYNSFQGSVWIFSSNGVAWSEERQLVPTGLSAVQPQLGQSAAMNYNGDVLIVGAVNDANRGSAVVFVKSGTGQWSQQTKLIGTGGSSGARQGWDVAINAAGNVTMVGGPYDTSYTGAAWIFVRNSTGSWTQEAMLVGSDYVGQSMQGSAVSLSTDGLTAAVGGPWDSSGGAVWIYTRTAGGTWVQMGNKIRASGTPGNGGEHQGYGVGLDKDGGYLFVSGYSDEIGRQGFFTFKKNNTLSSWDQIGNKVLAYDNLNGQVATQHLMTVSAYGGIVMLGQPEYNGSSVGAAWIINSTLLGV